MCRVHHIHCIFLHAYTNPHVGARDVTGNLRPAKDVKIAVQDILTNGLELGIFFI